MLVPDDDVDEDEDEEEAREVTENDNDTSEVEVVRLQNCPANPSADASSPEQPSTRQSV